MSDLERAMQSIDVRTDDGQEDYWREQVLLDEWLESGEPDADKWLAERDSKRKAKRPTRRAANTLPPSELRHQLALTKAQAGALLGGMSEDWIEKHVLPNVKTLKASRSVLIDAADLKRWVDTNSGSALA